MGSGSDDESMFKKQTWQQQSKTKYNLKILSLIVLTNLITIYFFTSPFQSKFFPISTTNTTQDDRQLISQIAALQKQLMSSQTLLEDLLDQLNGAHSPTSTYDDLLVNITHDEVQLSFGPHSLPLGNNPKMGTHIYSSIGGGCLKHKQDLIKYMSYKIGQECPSDDDFAQSLMLKGCEPLPRRRCHPKSPPNYVEPIPLPNSLWSTPPDTSITWDPYTCKNYTCLIERRNHPGIYDCKDCFHLQGREKTRWLVDNGGLDFGIDRVLAMKPRGSIRIGLDIGGGSGSFAARMKERKVTIITTSMNFDGPFNSFIASRGLVPMHVSIAQRFPFFENTLDIVHSMHVLSNWIPDPMLEFTLYDIYRVLRPGGLFWLDRFFCFGSQMNTTYVPMFDRVGFKKLRWFNGRKLDRGVEKNEWYFSALLEKPMT